MSEKDKASGKYRAQNPKMFSKNIRQSYRHGLSRSARCVL
jgi:hypothetical protein